MRQDVPSGQSKYESGPLHPPRHQGPKGRYWKEQAMPKHTSKRSRAGSIRKVGDDLWEVSCAHGYRDVQGISAYSTALYLPNNMAREFFGVCKDLVRGDLKW